jgi:hypothetical protein
VISTHSAGGLQLIVRLGGSAARLATDHICSCPQINQFQDQGILRSRIILRAVFGQSGFDPISVYGAESEIQIRETVS